MGAAELVETIENKLQHGIENVRGREITTGGVAKPKLSD